MTVHEACEVLGVRAGAYLEEIEAAYREQCSKRQACSSIA
jgi:DnaJ-domain-containing protein 1